MLRLRSLEALDVALSLATSGRESDYRVWSEQVVAGESVGRALGDDLDPQWAATLAQILARSMFDKSGEAVALAIYRELAARFGPDTFEPRDAQVYGQLLLQSGEHEALRGALPYLDLKPVIRRMLLTDLEQLDVATGRRPVAAWLAALQELLQLGSLGFELPDRRDPFQFDQLRSRADGEPVDGPLITVVMPAFAPDAGLETAVRSILAQTWQHLEVLIVDDASPVSTRHLFAAVAALDQRVRVISKPRNGGTYSARNTALTAARGEFITGQDADDWSHPERLERQVRPLLEDRSLVATVSRCLRVTDDLRTSSLRASGSSPVRMNSSSLLFRRTEVMHRMGYYDRVRKGADSEFIFRMRTVFGKRAVRELPECLALVRLVTGSLSRADFLPGWQHESRVWYRELYTHWHRGLRRGEDPFLAIDQRVRPFPAPARFVSSDVGTLEVDDLLIADLRELQPVQARLLALARQLAAQGRRVGLAHLERFDVLEPERRSLAPAILDALSVGEFAIIEWSQVVTAEHTVFWPAELAEFHGELQTQWRTGRVSLVVEDPLPLSSLPGSLLRWQASAAWVARNLRVEDGIGLVAPRRRDREAAVIAGEDHGALQQVGWFGASSHRREVVLVESAGHAADDGRLASVVDELAEHGIPLRIADLSESGEVLAHPRAVEVDGRLLEPWLVDAASDVVLVFIALDDRRPRSEAAPTIRARQRHEVPIGPFEHDHSGGKDVRFVPVAQPAVAASPSARSASVVRPQTGHRAPLPVAWTAPTPPPSGFVAVAGELGVSELRGWSGHLVGGVQYWFPGRGTAVVVPLAPDHRLRTPACAVAIRPGNGGAAEMADTWSEWSRSGIADPDRALTMWSASGGRVVLAVHDSHLWTVHSKAPAELRCASDQAGHLCAVATDELVLTTFLSALRGIEPRDGGPRGEDERVGRLVGADWRPIGSGWVHGNAVAFSALHGHALLPLGQLTREGTS